MVSFFGVWIWRVPLEENLPPSLSVSKVHFATGALTGVSNRRFSDSPPIQEFARAYP
jgi:hypothetical protein